MSFQTPGSTLAITVYHQLSAHYGNPQWRCSLPPLDELISTILSQNTNDKNRDRAFQALVAHFQSWESVRDAELVDIIETIRPAGLANKKAPRIQNILREITKITGTLTLDFLSELSTSEVQQWLLQFTGVGPKTAAIVMLFSLGLPAFPVDTHILRVTKRLGLIPQKLGAEKAHEHLGKMFPEDTYYSVHLNLIRLGREICHPRKPECKICPLQPNCAFSNNPQ